MVDEKDCCSSSGKTRCSIEAVLTVDDRGQILLPKELREKAGIKAGDKLAVIACIKDKDVCCLTLVPVNRLAESVKQFLGPLLKEILEG